MAQPTQTDSDPSSANLAYVEMLYEQYLQDPASVSEEWQAEFKRWQVQANGDADALKSFSTQPRFQTRSIFHPPSVVPPSTSSPQPGEPRSIAEQRNQHYGFDTSVANLQHRVDQVVRNYRVRGHIVAEVNPLGNVRTRDNLPELSLDYYGFTERDRDRKFYSMVMPDGELHTLKEIVEHLEATYCGEVSAQFMHIDNLYVREWLQSRMESTENRVRLAKKEQIRTLTRLTDAVIFEQFIQKKFIGAKSFSLEGAETLIPMLDMALEKAGEQGIEEVVIGMAHRGRLNVLANILGKSPQQIFREFADVDPELYFGGGDVKYHLGYSGSWRTRSGEDIHLSLCFNPSHLEFVNPVALGRLRAKQDRWMDDEGTYSRGEQSTCILIHGDAAFAGEGVVQETLNLSELHGYRTGGTVHIVVNNQIGFTTDSDDGRSTRYCTDIARMLQIPIFHVNGESPEAVANVVQLAMDFRAEFKKDVVIDMLCYRRRGHNESDEPTYTQPLMYEKINKRKTVRESYMESLSKLGEVTQEDADRIVQRRTDLLEKELTAAKSENFKVTKSKLSGLWKQYQGGSEADVPDVDTGLPEDELKALLAKSISLPDSFTHNPKLKRSIFRPRQEMIDGKRQLDWSAGECLAIAKTLDEGQRVRISGQDSQRGTFSHRHAVLHDIKTGDTYTPLANLHDKQGTLDIYNSPLSEAGVMGFDYGYSLDWPDGLICWEAQFGDFANAAQVIIDQFITSGEDKWKRLSGLTLLLPHGFEGQGPEHSSARLERFLNLGADDNIQVCQPSTPAQMFHLLRRQVARSWRKPLIVMTPKSLLRHPKCVSTWEEFTQGTYQRVIVDDVASKPKDVSRILMCSGKIYYELAEMREELKRDDVVILRMEQFFPFPKEHMKEALSAYDPKAPIIWVQDEPANMGAWPFLKSLAYHMETKGPRFSAIARKVSSSPATGSKAAHNLEQQRLIDRAFAPEDQLPHLGK